MNECESRQKFGMNQRHFPRRFLCLPQGNFQLYLRLVFRPLKIKNGEITARRLLGLVNGNGSPFPLYLDERFFKHGFNFPYRDFDAGKIQILGKPRTLPNNPERGTALKQKTVGTFLAVKIREKKM